MAPLYDLMLLVDASAPDERRKAVVAEVQAMLESGGEVVGAHDWGSRKITFEIDHRPEASYHLFQFESENALLERLQESLRIMDGVLRFRIIRQRRDSPPPPASPEAGRVSREDDEADGRVAARAAADAAPEPDAVEG